MGLGSVQSSNGTYLSIAGGFIWDRKKGKDDADYAEQSFIRADKTEGIRAGAQYANLVGTVIGVQFRTHDEYGESINITIEDKDGDRYIVSVSTNNKNSQDLMKALLIADLSKPLFMKPYDFIGSDKKRAQGISFRQDGEKISLRYEDVPAKFQKEPDFWKTASKKDIKRFFEDLSDWYVAEVEEKVCSQFETLAPQAKKEPKSGLGKSTESISKPADKVDEEEKKIPSKSKADLPSQLQMKKSLRAYIAENYADGEKLPSSLSKEEIIEWYNLSLQEEELPFLEDGDGEVPADELKNELGALLD